MKSILRSCTLLFVLRMALATAAEFEPEYEKAELRGPTGAILMRTGTEPKPRPFQEADGKKFVVRADVIEIQPEKDGEEPRRVPSADGRKLRLLTTAGRIALFAAENTKEEILARRHDLPAEIRRCDLDAASWLPSWRIGAATDGSAVNEPDDDGPVLGGVLAHGRTVVALTYDKPSRFARTSPPRWIIATSYNITSYQSDGLNPKWSKTFPWLGERFPEAMLTAGV